MIKKLLILILFTFISCAHWVMVPPKIDLTTYKKIGLISFTVENAKGKFDEISTRFFLQNITRSQRGTQIIELGTVDKVLKKINQTSINQEAVKAIGEHFGVNSIFYGKIDISDVKPHINISSLIRSMRVRATFNITITCRLISTKTGATQWTDSVFRKGTLAYVRLRKNRLPYFDIRDQDETYKRLIEQIIFRLTRDFRPTKRRE